ncbi:MAG: thiamine diphosphokinase [Oligosphaeraceae bacterium]|nr:thiamine diphosphokinase [Oligosphaeraceae bacterium]
MTAGQTRAEPFTVILAHGDFPQRPAVQHYLFAAQRIICCDGAAVDLLQFGLQPDLVVGDLDSLPAELDGQLPGRLVRVSEQESNDLSKALRYCLSRGWTNLLILGATGKREDHTLGNISLLADFCVQAPELKIISDYGQFLAVQGRRTIPCQAGQQVSIFSLHPDTAITSSGLRYPLQEMRLTRWWQATLNEACGSSFTLDFSGPGPLLLFLASPELP